MDSKPKSVNEVTLFSNGTGHFRRHYDVPVEGKEIGIFLNTNYIDTVVASIQVFGNVKIVTPPTFTPSNSNDTQLVINPSNTYWNLLSSLSGSEIVLDGADNVTLLGVDEVQQVIKDTPFSVHYIVVLDVAGQVMRHAWDSVTRLEFKDSAVKAEINKALKNNFKKIKPDATSVDLVIASNTDKPEKATVEYTHPVAAWKMRYVIRERNGDFVLEGSAVIDNNSSDDWNDFIVSVVTGNPRSFDSEIATVVVPARHYLNVTTGSTQNPNAQAYAPVAAMSVQKSPEAYGGGKFSMRNTRDVGLDENIGAYSQSLAVAPGVESKEVGDFCVYTAKEPITILSRKSAVVQMFSVPLKSCGILMVYNKSINADLPMRAVKFKNMTSYSLGKGKTTVYNNGVFSGEGALSTTKPGENQILSHCAESGIKCFSATGSTETKAMSVKLAKGAVVSQTHMSVPTSYIFENTKDTPFKMLVEHDLRFDAPQPNVEIKGVELLDTEHVRSTNKYRFYFSIPAKTKVCIDLTETTVTETSFMLNGAWIKTNIKAKSPLMKNKEIVKILEVQKQLDAVEQEIKDVKSNNEKLNGKSERIRKNIETVSSVAGQNKPLTDWIKELDLNEKSISESESVKLPELNDKFSGLRLQLQKLMQEVEVVWE